MRTKMHFAHGYGASPERVREYAFDQFTARAMLDDVARLREAARAFAEQVAAAYEGHLIWARDTDSPHARGDKLSRLIAALEELLDEFADQNKLAEAEEML